MKHNKKQALIILVFSAILIMFLGLHHKQKKDFHKKLEAISKNSSALHFSYQDIFQCFYTDNYRYPNNTKELNDFFVGDSFYSSVFHKNIDDPFSSKQQSLHYVPVFSKANGICEGFLLISAGIDGKIDNQLPDTTYFESVNTLRFYNSLKPATSLSFRKYDLHFSLKDYLFDNKNLLVEYANGVEIFINNASQRLYTPVTLMSKLYPKGFTKLDCSVEGNAKRLNDSTIIIADKTNRVVCSMYKGRSAVIGESKHVKIVGKFRNRIDPANNTLYLENCIVISK